MRKKKDSSREKEKQKKSQRSMRTYYEWLWYCPRRLHEHPDHQKDSEVRKTWKSKEKDSTKINTVESSNFSQVKARSDSHSFKTKWALLANIHGAVRENRGIQNLRQVHAIRLLLLNYQF